MYLRSSNSLHAYWRLYCVKYEAILSNSMLWGSGCGYQLECLHAMCSPISACGNMHVQLTMWYDSANHSDNDENKHDKVTFQLAAVDLNS